MTATAELLTSLETISYETVRMLQLIDAASKSPSRPELKRRVLELRGNAQELIDWLTESRLEEPTN